MFALSHRSLFSKTRAGDQGLEPGDRFSGTDLDKVGRLLSRFGNYLGLGRGSAAANTVQTPDGRHLDLDYFVHWRQYVWRKPVLNMLAFLGDLRGKHLLHIGDFTCRMTSLYALMGAKVTLADPYPVEVDELDKWGVRDKVTIVTTRGGLAELGDARFDMVVTKSVLWCIPDLKPFLGEIAAHVRPGGKVAFVENPYGGPVTVWLRRHLRRARLAGRESRRFGVKKSQLPWFRDQFERVSIRSHFGMVYVILGYARSPVPSEDVKV
jgi:SAM-dependent methyltransferase